MAEIELLRFLRHLADGGVIEGGGEIGQMLRFVGQLDDAQQPVAQAAVFFLHQSGQGPHVAAAPNPVARPGQEGRRGPGESAEENEDPQPDGRFPEPVGHKNREHGKQEAGGDAADGRRGLDAPEALLDPFKLPAQPFGQVHQRVVLVLRHAVCAAHTLG